MTGLALLLIHGVHGNEISSGDAALQEAYAGPAESLKRWQETHGFGHAAPPAWQRGRLRLPPDGEWCELRVEEDQWA